VRVTVRAHLFGVLALCVWPLFLCVEPRAEDSQGSSTPLSVEAALKIRQFVDTPFSVNKAGAVAFVVRTQWRQGDIPGHMGVHPPIIARRLLRDARRNARRHVELQQLTFRRIFWG
jgi:hypothetical protein